MPHKRSSLQSSEMHPPHLAAFNVKVLNAHLVPEYQVFIEMQPQEDHCENSRPGVSSFAASLLHFRLTGRSRSSKEPEGPLEDSTGRHVIHRRGFTCGIRHDCVCSLKSACSQWTWYKPTICIAVFFFSIKKQQKGSRLTAVTRPGLPGGEPEDFGDEAGGQAVDAGLGRRPAQGAVGAAQLRLLLLLAQLPAVEGLQQLHGLRFPLGALAFLQLRFPPCATLVPQSGPLLENPGQFHFSPRLICAFFSPPAIKGDRSPLPPQHFLFFFPKRQLQS